MIKVGDVIKLRPSVFDKEYQTCEWSNKYLYEDQFQHISLRFKKLNQPGDRVKTIFGSSETVVEEIEKDDEGNPWFVDGLPFILLTDKFEIVFPEALKKKEIAVLSSEDIGLKSLASEKQLIEDLEFFEQNYLEGIFNVLERENNKNAAYRTGFYMMKREGKWEQ
jgi:hypothetical protein